LLAWVGCCADSFEQARWFGDDIAARADYYPTDLVGANKARFAIRHLGAGGTPPRRVRTALEFLVSGRDAIESMRGTHCLLAGDLAQRLGLGEPVRAALGEVFEWWDGRWNPGLLAGAAISRPARLVQFADVVEVFHREGGVEAAVAVARERSGAQFDPEVVECFCDRAGELLASLDATTGWDVVIDAEPVATVASSPSIHEANASWTGQPVRLGFTATNRREEGDRMGRPNGSVAAAVERHGTSRTAELYGMKHSHPVLAARMACELVGLNFEPHDLFPGLHGLIVRAHGFRGWTRPGARD
jgi:hypothetical protein